jgi:hypothetical protein
MPPSLATTKRCALRGLKFSHVEMRALETIFGKDNPVTDEIMSYMQGSDNLQEILKMNASKVGEIPQGIPTLTHDQVRSVDQRHGTIVPETAISGTVVDENFVGGGFALRLPFPYQTVYDLDGELLHEGAPMGVENMTPDQRASIGKVFETSHIYVPEGTLRKCWKHASGRFGLNDLGVIVNGVVNTMKTADGRQHERYPLPHLLLDTYHVFQAYFGHSGHEDGRDCHPCHGGEISVLGKGYGLSEHHIAQERGRDTTSHGQDAERQQR